MLQHLKNLSLLTFSQIISSSGILLINIIWARGYTTEEYGTYKLLISTLSFFSVFSLSGLNNSLIISSGKSKEKNFVKIFNIKSIAGIILSLCFYILAKKLYFFKNLSDITILIVTILFPLYVNNNNWRYFFQGNSRFKPYFFNIIIESLTTLLIVYYSYLSKYNFQILICLLIASRVLTNNLFNLNIIKKSLNKNFDENIIRKGLFFTPGLIIGSLLFLENYIESARKLVKTC